MKWLRSSMPVLSIAVLTFAAALPWGLAAEDRFVLPLLPVIAIYHWTLDPDAWLPDWAIFIAGLTLDVLTQGPLGYWALVYLCAYTVAMLVSHRPAASVAGRMAFLAFAIVVVTGFAWLLASLYFLQLLNWRPYAWSALVTIVVAFALAPLLGISWSGAKSAARGIRLTRGSE